MGNQLAALLALLIPRLFGERDCVLLKSAYQINLETEFKPIWATRPQHLTFIEGKASR
jgi:hypothetical protein